MKQEGRNPDGTFKKGHKLACAHKAGRKPGDKALLEKFKASISGKDMKIITGQLITKCKSGNLAAIKLLFSYLFGLPKQTVDIGAKDLLDAYTKELPRVTDWFEQHTGS